MNEHLFRDVTNRELLADEARLSQPFASPTRTVRLTIDHPGTTRTGEWRPWTTNYTSEIHDLVHECGRRLGVEIKRIAFSWNKSSLSHRSLMTADDLILTRGEPGQPPDEMRITASSGTGLRLRVVPPA